MKKHLLCASIIIAAFHLSAEPQSRPADRTKKKQELFLRGEPLDNQFPPAYNACAAIDVTQKFCWWPTSIFVDASFLYWHGSEEGLSLASNGVLNGGNLYLTPNTATVFQSFGFKPGFQVGLGAVTRDKWVIYSEYTWLRGSETTSRTPSPSRISTAGIATATASTGTPVFVVDDWFIQGTSNGQALAGSRIASKWQYGLDFLDVTASRPFYQGRNVTVTPYAGVRGALIRQRMKVTLNESTGLSGITPPSSPIASTNKSSSWGLGPRVGFDGTCLLPMGFRFEGDFAANLLFTRYTTISHKEDAASTTFNPGPYITRWHGYNCLRPIAEVGLGFGWGRYLACKNYHIDFSALYDFTLLWEQNVIRMLLDRTLTGTSPSATDMAFHGLTLG